MILLRISSRWNFALRPSVFYNFERLQPGMAASATETWSTVTSGRAKNEIASPIYLLERQFITKEAALVTPVKESEIYGCLIQVVHPSVLRQVQRISDVWRVYLHDSGARAKLLLQGLYVRSQRVSFSEQNPFTLRARMANIGAVQVTIKDLPFDLDDRLVTQFLTESGCKVLGKVMKRMIRYNNQLTSCLNGDRLVYIEALPKKAIPRSSKVGEHSVTVYYDGQIVSHNKQPLKKTLFSRAGSSSSDNSYLHGQQPLADKAKTNPSLKIVQQQQLDSKALEDYIDEIHKRIVGQEVTPVPPNPLLPPPSSSSSVPESDSENTSFSANLAVIVERGSATAEDVVEGSGEETEEASTRVDSGMVGGAIVGTPLDSGRRSEEAPLSAECSDFEKKGGEGSGEEEAEGEVEMVGGASVIPPEKGASPSMLNSPPSPSSPLLNASSIAVDLIDGDKTNLPQKTDGAQSLMSKLLTKLSPSKAKRPTSASKASNAEEYPPLTDTRILSQKQQDRSVVKAQRLKKRASLVVRCAQLDGIIEQQKAREARLERQKKDLALPIKKKTVKIVGGKRSREHNTSPCSPSGKKVPAPHVCKGDSVIDCFDLVCPVRALNKSF